MTQETLLTEELLLERVRERVAQQRVPCEVPRSILVTRGEGFVCDVCDARVANEEPAYELEFGSAGGTRTIRLHHRCYIAWESHCLDRRVLDERP
jgi:hypothetical protein